ncbi:murein hydrolase activator EnvC family protein [Hufsiella ginkgonis]|uniref:Peptidoglycan DD-metalloendopeptidase family protein n=1 Tax=Hufsiella ginkgonis TaxID=2695274 RepID=A0A7K1XWZ7_9SPHI|nr:peptidoglycan DD-metalloendopeptidase family protein [Hufsiella ginkgonis]MXV15328.1 peptidoglycan DD-metalloendopeptidase family protein [Hufsiella ginkgonis]
MKLYRLLSTLIVCLFFTTVAAQPKSEPRSSAELKRRKTEITKEIAALNKSLNQTAGSKKLSLKQINALTAQIRLREDKINTINSEIRLLDNQISGNTQTVRNLQTQLNKLKKQYAAMILFAFRNRSSYSKIMFVFASKDFNQAYKRLKYLSQFSEYRIRQAGEIQHTQGELKVKIKELDNDKKEKSSLLVDEEEEKQTLGKQKNKQNEELGKLTEKEKKLRQQLSAKQQEAIKVNKAMQAAIAREIQLAREREEREIARAAEAARVKAAKEAAEAAAKRKANPEALPAPKPVAPKPAVVSKGSDVLISNPGAAKLSAEFAGNRGQLPSPVSSGRISRGFGKNKDGVNVITENYGIDISTSSGAEARAVFEGEVSTVQNMGGFYAVLIRHGEYFTVYSNLRSVSVSRGQKVSTKQSVGTILTDPFDGSTQLHFEVRKGMTPQNPAAWIAR